MKKYILPAALLLCLGVAGTASAQQWMHFKSKTDLFGMRIFDNVKEEVYSFRLNNRQVAQHGQAVSTFDQRGFKSVVKNYIMKYEQTLGYNLSAQDVANLLKKELDLYEAYYTNLNGVLRDRKDSFLKYGYPAGEIYVRYEDPELGEQSIRISVVYTETTKFQHILSGPDDMMTAFKTRKHYESVSLKNGYALDRGSIQDDWLPITSPLRLFTVYLPEQNGPYYPQKHTVSNSKHIERVSAVFRDPILNQQVYYNVYAYVPNGEVNMARAESITTERHIKRHRLSADGLRFNRLAVPEGELPIATIGYDIRAPKGKPDVRWVKLRVTYAEDKVLVHELLGPRRLVESPFFDYVVSNVKFHPQLYLSAKEAEMMGERDDAVPMVEDDLDADDGADEVEPEEAEAN